jgi:hypothetical protein
MNAFASLPSACLDLEVPIRDVTYMAGIARDLAWDLLNGETPKTDGADVIIRMSNRQHDQLLFAIERSHDMALDLEKTYHGRTVAA